MKKYQDGGSKKAPSISYDKKLKMMDIAGKTMKPASPPMKTGAYKIDKTDPKKEAYKKDPVGNWAKKERQMTNPKNKPAGSPIRQLKKGGGIKKK
jgi:hypothetical protein